MKVYVLLRHIDYEGSDVLAVYRKKEVAEAWLEWCRENNGELRDSIGVAGGLYKRKWRFPHFPGDWYTVECHEIKAKKP